MKYDYEDQFTEALKTIDDNALKRKLVAIKKLVCERLEAEREYKKEHNELDHKYEQLYKPFYEKRQKIIEGEEKPDIEEIREKLEKLKIQEDDLKNDEEKGIPDFWFKVFENCPDYEINEKDSEILKKLKNVECVLEQNGNFKLVYTFYPNDYFSNTTITRDFILDADFDISEITCDVIDWKSDEMNPTIKIVEKTMKNKKTGKIKKVKKKEANPSFFSSFKNFKKKETENKKKDEEEDESEEDEEADINDEYDLAMELKDEIIPYAIEYYLGIADAGGDEDEEEEDEDDMDEEEEEEEEDDKKKKKKGRPRRK